VLRAAALGAVLLALLPAAAARAHGDATTSWLLPAQHARPLQPTKFELLYAFGEMSVRERIAFQETGRGGPGPAGEGGARTHAWPTGRPAGEPTLAVGRDGTLYFVGLSIPTRDDQGGVTIHSVLQRSRDGGRTWQELDAAAPGARGETTTLDPFIALDPRTDRLVNADYTPPCAVVSVSADGGDTFAANPLCGQHTDHQSVAFGPDGQIYYCAIDGGALQQGSAATACSKSTDGGRTFLRTGAPAFVEDGTRTGGQLGVPGHCAGAAGHLTVDHRGWLWLPRGFCDQPFVAVSRDEGATWERSQVAGLGMFVGAQFEEHEASVAVDREGNAYYLWVARDHLPYMSVSRDGGRTWGRPVMVGEAGLDEAQLPSIAVGDPGRVALLYMGTTTSPGPPYCARTTLDACVNEDGSPGRPAADYASTTWNGHMAVSTNALARDPQFTTATVNDPADPLIRGVCGPVRCQQAYDFLKVVIAPDGTAWGAFVDGCPADPAAACPPLGKGLAVQLTGVPPLLGTRGEQRPQVAAPPARRCASRRRFPIRLRHPRRGRIRSVKVTVDGRRVRVRRLRATVDLRGKPPGRYAVRIVIRTSAGRTFRELRRYRTCAR
jgi:hypothetical protein